MLETNKSADGKYNSQLILTKIKNFNIVSLNYERCFAYHFFPKIYDFFTEATMEDKDFLRTQEKEIVDFFHVDQPHGSLGGLLLGHDIQLRSGNPVVEITTSAANKNTRYINSTGQRPYGVESINGNNIELVGEVEDMTKNYKKINNRLSNDDDEDKYCLVIGLSKDGLSGCKINWDKF